jgi:hypothetical protein
LAEKHELHNVTFLSHNPQLFESFKYVFSKCMISFNESQFMKEIQVKIIEQKRHESIHGSAQ